MVSHSLNLFWSADVYPTVSHKNCPKKKEKTWDPCIGRVPCKKHTTSNMFYKKRSKILASPEFDFLYSCFLISITHFG